MKVKSVKRERNKKVEEKTTLDEMKSFIFTFVGVLGFLGLCYLGMLGMQALGVFDKGYIVKKPILLKLRKWLIYLSGL